MPASKTATRAKKPAAKPSAPKAKRATAKALAPWDQYAADVLAGRVVACRYVKQACKRYHADLKRQGTKGFSYVFSPDAAQHVIDFCQALNHSKGKWARDKDPAKTRIHLEPWQQFIVAQLYGWLRPDGFRRFTRAYIEVARKNGKTTLGAALANHAFWNDDEAGPEIFFGATKLDQAAIGWREAADQIKKCPALMKRARIIATRYSIMKKADASARMRPLARDATTEDGSSPSFALVDEYHAHNDAGLLEVIESGTGAREQPLVLIITTAGFNKNGPCYLVEHKLAKDLLSGVVQHETEFAIIYTIDDRDDWTDPRVWIKANPNLGVSVDEEKLAKSVELAKKSHLKINGVKTKNLNIWTQANAQWITDDVWMSCAFPVDEAALVGRRCYAALDLSISDDFSALALVFPPALEGERWAILWRFYLPAEASRDVGLWRDSGILKTQAREDLAEFITYTPGDVIDYDYIEDDIRELGKRFVIQEIAYDKWHAQELVNHLQDEFQMFAVAQKMDPMAIYASMFEQRVKSKELAHGGNPVARWMMSCCEVIADNRGNSMPGKPKRGQSDAKIDGIIAGIMAMGRAVLNANQATPSVYETRDLLIL